MQKKTHQPEGNTVISEKDKPSITLAMVNGLEKIILF